ncbi:MAG: hypothetical protein CEN90_665 [Parcubacteria group bacterium Licking1014_17]|nr:MAG: hypothetical protein CEN90_665 [Parcubacteria group bacterium Licking1014_17]
MGKISFRAKITMSLVPVVLSVMLFSIFNFFSNNSNADVGCVTLAHPVATKISTPAPPTDWFIGTADNDTGSPWDLNHIKTHIQWWPNSIPVKEVVVGSHMDDGSDRAGWFIMDWGCFKDLPGNDVAEKERGVNEGGEFWVGTSTANLNVSPTNLSGNPKATGWKYVSSISESGCSNCLNSFDIGLNNGAEYKYVYFWSNGSPSGCVGGICEGVSGSNVEYINIVNPQTETATPTPTPTPSVDIKANGSDNPPQVTYGGQATLTWTSKNATSCQVPPNSPEVDWSGDKPLKNTTGEVKANLTNPTYTYKIKCSDSKGNSASDSVTVKIALPPLLVDLKAAQNESSFADPVSGSVPFLGIDLKATVSNVASGSLSYYFYCQNTLGTSAAISSSYNPYQINNLCDYWDQNGGTYTAKVLVKQGSRTATDTATITSVKNNLPQVLNVKAESANGCFLSGGPTEIISWTYKDIDNDPQSGFKVVVHKGTATGPVIQDSCSKGTCAPGNTSASYTVTDLEWGQNYSVEVFVWDKKMNPE